MASESDGREKRGEGAGDEGLGDRDRCRGDDVCTYEYIRAS